jgi:hypothetical protein
VTRSSQQWVHSDHSQEAYVREQSVGRPTRFARLPYVLGPSVTSLAELSKRMRRRGLTLRVTRRFCRSHDASPNHIFCHARVVYSVGQERRSTAMRTLWDNAPFGFGINRAHR